MRLGLRAAAKALGISHVALLKAAKAGRVSRAEDGSFNVEECKKQLERNTNPKKRHSERAESGSGNNAGDYNAAATQLEWLKVDKTKLELERRRGELVPIAEINAYVAGMIIRARDILLRIGPELRDRLAQEADPVACEGLIDGEVQRALRELAEYEHSPD